MLKKVLLLILLINSFNCRSNFLVKKDVIYIEDTQMNTFPKGFKLQDSDFLPLRVNHSPFRD